MRHYLRAVLYALFVVLPGDCPLGGFKHFCHFPSTVLQKISNEQTIVISSDESEGSDELPNVKYPRYVLLSVLTLIISK